MITLYRLVTPAFDWLWCEEVVAYLVNGLRTLGMLDYFKSVFQIQTGSGLWMSLPESFQIVADVATNVYQEWQILLKIQECLVWEDV